MCGGTLEISTCSHVGHVFRKSTPYTFPGGTSKIVNKNNARLAEVWLDDWKEFYYSINPGQLHTAFPATYCLPPAIVCVHCFFFLIHTKHTVCMCHCSCFFVFTMNIYRSMCTFQCEVLLVSAHKLTEKEY